MKLVSALLLAGLLFACGNSKTVASTTTTKISKEKTTNVSIDTGISISQGSKIATTPNKPTVEPAETTDSTRLNNTITSAPATKFNHGVWDTLLKKHVSAQGVVAYDGFSKNSEKLRAYIDSLSENLPAETWTQEEKLAYWMNAYNAMTVDLILRNLPLESIKDIDKPWDQRLWKLGDKWYNLDEIEHQILRKMNEPRIHFGINCASYSCPLLLNEAFTAKKVDAQLDFLAKQFINDPTRNTITPDRVEISKIFKWFGKDFKKSGSLVDYLNQYSDVKISADAKVRYKDYNWALNN